jgi:ATP-dependent helicase/nuclease subunit A
VLPAETGAPAAAEAAARRRGTAIHRLLEVLPLHPEARWPALAARLAGDDAAAALAEVAPLLRDPDLAPLFSGADVLAEVAVTAALDALGGRRILGRIDRLLVGPERVLAVDFKSNALVPDTPEAVPEGLSQQMGAYAAALAQVYPGRRIETAILWTATGRLMPLPDAVVQAALRRAPDLDAAGPGS